MRRRRHAITTPVPKVLPEMLPKSRSGWPLADRLHRVKPEENSQRKGNDTLSECYSCT